MSGDDALNYQARGKHEEKRGMIRLLSRSIPATGGAMMDRVYLKSEEESK